jgi:transposase
MASITKKIINGYPYYYARESQRVKGKPKIVWQKYLGKIEHIIKAVEDKNKPKPNSNSISTPDEVIISQFGAVAAIYDISKRWGMVEIIDSVSEKRNQGLSVGHYILIAAINRCVSPKSKSKIADWFWNTPLRRWLPVTDKRTLASQRFWDNMALLDTSTIREAEKKLTRALIQVFNIDTRCLLYDTTNFITHIDTFNEENTLAQRGKAKQGGGKFRIIGLALLVSSDFHIPLFHEAYPGNNPDCKEFDSVVDRLVERYKVLSQAVENITLVFDKGNNSKNNFDRLETTPYHFVGSLKLNDNGVEELLDISLQDFKQMTCPRLQGVRAYRLQRNIFGYLRTVVITYNEELFLTQSQTVLREARKRTVNLKALAITLSRWLSGDIKNGKKPTIKSVQDKVKDILKGQYMDLIIKTDITLVNEFPVLSYSVDHKEMEQLSRKRLGKTILFTDNNSWTDEEIILAYRGQYRIEKAFETMKNPHFVSWSPMWHWTDHNVRVHAFYCVLALTLVSLLQRELYQQGFHFSIPKLIDLLSNISEVVMVKYKNKKTKSTKQGKEKEGARARGRGRQDIHEAEPQIVISKMDTVQQKIFEALRLERYIEAKA